MEMGNAALAAIILGALLAGALLGWVFRDPAAAWRWLVRKVTRRAIVLALLFTIAIAGLVALSQTEVGSPQLWAQLISATSLLFVTLLLFSTGDLLYTPKKEFTVTTDDTTKTYTVGSILSQGEYAELPDPNKQDVTQQRGLYFRGLYTGADGRWSTSKVQVLLWTYAVVFAVLAIFVALQLDGALELAQGDQTGGRFSDLEFDDQYLLLLGGYFAAALLAKGITTAKTENGTQVKEPAAEARDTKTGAKDLVSNDGGQGDLGDTQFFFFNLVALTVFFVSFIPHLERGMPDLPWFLVGLTSVSALAYVGKKSVESGTPTIASVTPSKARPRDRLRIEGAYLATSLERPPTVMVDGLAAIDVKVLFVSGPVGEQSVVQAVVPDGVASGENKGVIVTPRGGKAVTAQISIVETTIASVSPDPVPWRGGAPVTIAGQGFGLDPGPDRRKVTLGNLELQVREWREAALIALMPAETHSESPPTEPLALVVTRDEVDLVTRPTAAGFTAMKIAGVDPTALTLVKGTAVTLTGCGFGPRGDDCEVRLNDVALDIQAWSDTEVVAVLGEQFPPSSPPAQNQTLNLSRTGYSGAAKTVEVTLPTVSVTAVHPAEVPAKEGTQVTVVGTGFGLEESLDLCIGQIPLSLSGDVRSDTLLHAALGTVPDSVVSGLESGPLETTLVVMRSRWEPGSKEVSLKRPS